MNLDLLTIANRATLGTDIQTSIDNSKARIDQIKAIVGKIEASGAFTQEEKAKELEFSIIGVVSILEQHLNDVLYHIYVAFPSKLGKRQFDIAELQEKGSLLEMFYDKATQRILDLAYGRFEKFVIAFLEAFEIQTQIDADLIADVNEIKCTRDCLIHSNGKANALYMSKAGAKARVQEKGDTLKTDKHYFTDSADKLIDFISKIEALIPQKYKESTKAYVFKQMWDATCLSRRVQFEQVWNIESPSVLSAIDLDNNFGFSTSEMEVYNLFRYAFGGRIDQKVDYALFFERWEPSTNEYQIAMSWLNNQFYF